MADDLYQVHTAEYRNPAQLRDGPVLVVGGGNSGVQIAVELCEQHDVYLSTGREMKFMSPKWLGKSVFWWFDKLGLFERVTIETKLGQKLSQSDSIMDKEIVRRIAAGDIVQCARTTGADGKRISFADGHSCTVENIIWATGYRDDYRWIDVDGVFDAAGNIIHRRGQTDVEGLFFLGRPWQYRRGSALLLGVGQDAEYLANFF